MFKKLSLIVLAVLVSTAALVPLAAAQEPTPPAGERNRNRAAGKVTAVGANSFELHTRSGADLKLHVDAATVYQDIQGNPKSFSDLKVAGKVGVAYELRGEAAFARRVLILPECTGERPCFYRGVGQVTSVGDNSFEFTGLRGRQWTFEVDEDTRFISRDGSIRGLSDLKAGTPLFVAAWKNEDGEWYALIVRGPVLPRPTAQPTATP